MCIVESSKEGSEERKYLVAMRMGETPVPIPNTTVKPHTAESTMLETAWEGRWLPGSFKRITRQSVLNKTDHSNGLR